MSDNIRESLSALMDGEASEIEIHRLLREMEQNPELRLRWLSYQQIRGVLRREPYISRSDHLALAERVHASIAAEEAYADATAGAPAGARFRYLKPVAGLAVAASVVAAILVTFSTGRIEEQGTLATGSGTANSPAAAISAHRTVGDATYVSTMPETAGRVESTGDAGAAIADDGSDSTELRELDEERMRQVRAYLMRHDRMARMNPYARVVTNPETPRN